MTVLVINDVGKLMAYLPGTIVMDYAGKYGVVTDDTPLVLQDTGQTFWNVQVGERKWPIREDHMLVATVPEEAPPLNEDMRWRLAAKRWERKLWGKKEEDK